MYQKLDPNKIVETLKYFGGVRAVSTVQETTLGNEIEWPTNDDTANVGAILAENSAMTEQDVTLGTASIAA